MLCLLLGITKAVQVSTNTSTGYCHLKQHPVNNLSVIPISIVTHFTQALFCFIYFQLIRWLPTVLTVRTPEEGWRTKSELFASALGLSSWHSQWRLVTHLGFLFHFLFFLWVCCRLLPWQQTISKITIFLLFSTYLPPFLELAVTHLETRESCEKHLISWK